jgi:hypothetical protein
MVSVTAELFIGLVTHPRSRFPAGAGPDGLAQSLARALADKGVSTEVAVHDQDVWTPDLLVIDEQEIADSIDAELDVEARWRAYLNPRTNGLALRAVMAARRVRRRHRFLPRGVAVGDEHAGFRMVRRLVNIEVAHLSLMTQARDSGAGWSLILEDDATGDPTSAARVVRAVMAAAQGSDGPRYVNVSRSFDEGRLGIEHLLTDLGPVPEAEGVHALSAERPVTNTVCAVLYRGDFLQTLVPALDGIPLSPVIPIDWKLNEALMTMFESGQTPTGACWLLRPAPILQGSMHG